MSSVRVSGVLGLGALQTALDALLERHEALRTRFVVGEDGVRQVIDPPYSAPLRVADLSDLSAPEAEREMARLVQEFAGTEIDLCKEPLFDAKLLRLSATDHVLLLGVDHMVCDAASCAIIRRDLWSLYEHATQGTARPAPLRIQFADYAVWLQSSHGAWMEKHAAYWRARLSSTPRSCFSHNTVVAAKAGNLNEQYQLGLGAQLSAQLRDAAIRERTLLPLIALSSYAAVISRWCGQRDLLLESLSHGRHSSPHLQDVVGFFANRLHLRIELQPEGTILELLARVTREFYSAYQHQDHGRVPDFIPDAGAQLYFNWLPSSWARTSAQQSGNEDDSGPAVEPFAIPLLASRVESAAVRFTVMFAETSDDIETKVWYPPHRFSPSTIERFSANLRLFLEAFVRSPHERISAVALHPLGSG